MPNYCDFNMRVRGEKENVLKLYHWLSAGYNYGGEEPYCYNETKSGEKIPCEHHIGYRVFEVFETEEDVKSEYDGNDFVSLSGYCAWSVMSCMFNRGFGTYMGDKDYEKSNVSKAISIDDASKELGLQIEIFSEEPGMCFSEHYFIDNGEIKCEEDTEYTDLCLEYYDKENEYYEEDAYNELSEEMKARVNEAIENGEDYLQSCDWLDEDGYWDWKYIN